MVGLSLIQLLKHGALGFFCDIGPMWLKICHKIANGFMGDSESLKENSHNLLKKDIKTNTFDTENHDCQITTHVIKRGMYLQDIVETNPNLIKKSLVTAIERNVNLP